MIASTSRWNNLFSRLKPLIVLLGAGALMALAFLFAKLADQAAMPRLGFLMTAVFGAGVMLLAMALWRRQRVVIDRRTLAYGVITGAIFALPNALAFSAIARVGAGFVSLGFAFPLLITWLMALALGMERFQWRRLAGVMLGLSGGAILALGKALEPGASAVWMAAVAAIPVVLAIGNIYRTRFWPGDAAPLFLAALMLLFAALWLLPMVALLEGRPLSRLFGSRYGAWLLLGETAIFALFYFLYFLLQKIAGPVYLSQIGIVTAPIAIALAVAFLDEPVPPHLLPAGALVLVGTLIVQRSQRPDNSSPTRPRG